MIYIDWQHFNCSSPPAVPGVYAFRLNERWLYIGRSKNIKTRLCANQHIAFRTAKEIKGTKFLYYPTNNYCQLERRLIKELSPEWNGHQSWGCLGSEKYLYAATGWYCETDYTHARSIILDQVLRLSDRVRLMGLLPEHLSRLKAGDLTVLAY